MEKQRCLRCLRRQWRGNFGGRGTTGAPDDEILGTYPGMATLPTDGRTDESSEMNAACGTSTQCRVRKRNAGNEVEMSGEMDAGTGNDEGRDSLEVAPSPHSHSNSNLRPYPRSRIPLPHSALVEIPHPTFISPLSSSLPSRL